jgi:hypothetical protein
MKKLVFGGAIGLATLVFVGLAVAKGLEQTPATLVSGTFAATAPVGHTETKTCTTTTGQTLATTHQWFSGTATSATGDLNGKAAIEVRSLVNQTAGVGTVNGTLQIAATGGKSNLHFQGVYDHGAIAGLATGKAATHGVQLVANISASFTTTAGFSGGKIGGTSGGSAVEVGPGHCAPAKPKPAPKPAEKADVTGTVTTALGTSITVAGVTCAVPASLSAAVTALKANVDTAHIVCSLQNGVLTLVKVEKHH